jgi:NTP pyrophosphatase (non-canonical NTP hydrolase)
MQPDDLIQLRDRLREFARERDWEQFHTPKNLASALCVEASEVLEHFQWSPSAPARELPQLKRNEIGDELADVLIYLVRLADVMDVDLMSAADAKMAKNAAKYPAALTKGKSSKYTDL